MMVSTNSLTSSDDCKAYGRRVQKYKRTLEDSIHQGQSFGTGRVAGLTDPAHCACAQPVPSIYSSARTKLD